MTIWINVSVLWYVALVDWLWKYFQIGLLEECVAEFIAILFEFDSTWVWFVSKSNSVFFPLHLGCYTESCFKTNISNYAWVNKIWRILRVKIMAPSWLKRNASSASVIISWGLNCESKSKQAKLIIDDKVDIKLEDKVNSEKWLVLLGVRKIWTTCTYSNPIWDKVGQHSERIKDLT